MNEKEQLIKMKEDSGFNWKEFSAYFGIPYRTVQDWEHRKRKMPLYLLHLMEYKLKIDQLMKQYKSPSRAGGD